MRFLLWIGDIKDVSPYSVYCGDAEWVLLAPS